MIKKYFLIAFFYTVYTIRLILSVFVNFLLFFLLISKKNRNKIRDVENMIKKSDEFGVFLSLFDLTCRKDNIVIHYLTIFFTLHPKLYIIIGYGDCLTHSNFTRWAFYKWCSDHGKEKPNMNIVEIISMKPIITKNHSFIFVKENNNIRMWTPYRERNSSNITDSIVYFELKYKCLYYHKLLKLL